MEEVLIVIKIRASKENAYHMKEELEETLEEFFFDDNKDAKLEGQIEIEDVPEK